MIFKKLWNYCADYCSTTSSPIESNEIYYMLPIIEIRKDPDEHF